MRTPGRRTRLIATGLVAVAAVAACWLLYKRYIDRPWTRDARLSADIVMVVPRVSGVVVAVPVIDNQFVNQGDLLFQVDTEDYELAVASARVGVEQARQEVTALEAAVTAAEAGVGEAEAGVTTARADVVSAQAQVASAKGEVDASVARLRSAQAMIDKESASLEEAVRDRDRAERLAADGAGSVALAESRAAAVQKAEASLDGSRAGLMEARAEADQARASLRKSRADLTSAEAELGEAEAKLASAHATMAQAEANFGIPGEENVYIQSAKMKLAGAELDLEWAAVFAPGDGYITNLNVDVGDYAAAGTPMLAFVDAESFHVEGFFQETQLRRIRPGDRAVITLMSHRRTPIEGVVESIGWAINPPDIATTEGAEGLVPQVEPSFDWIRLAQRVPVRIKLSEIPEGVVLISGTTASVAILSAN